MPESDRETADIDKYFSTLCTDNQRLVRHFIRSKQLAGVRPTTIMTQQVALHSLVRFLGDIPLDTITKEQLEDWYLWFREEPTKHTRKKPSKTTVLNVVSSVRQFYETIYGAEKTAELFKQIKPQRDNKPAVQEEELLTDDEIQRMLTACTGERDRAIIAVLASSGCRVGELCNLKLKDVKPYRERVALHLNGKTGERDIDIYDGVPELKKWLQVHPYKDDADAPVFINKVVKGTGKYAPLTDRGVEKMLTRIAVKAGIPENKRWNPHSFRHKRATDLADHLTTADLRVMFGWTEMSNTPARYVHSSRAKVSRKLAELAGVKTPEEHQVMRKMVKYCPVCGAANEITATHCINCWVPLEEDQARAERKAKEMMKAYLKEMEENKKKGKK